MRKRRVLALLLALSLTVSGNSMTVLAAEQGIEPALETQVGETTEKPSEDEKLTEETAGETGEESSAGEDKSKETGETDPGGAKDEDGTDESSEKGDTEEPGQEEPVQDDSVSENDIAADSEETEETEEVRNAEVRIMTFTDDAGLRITYDANAARSNAEEAVIKDGVLTEISGDVKDVIDLREKTEITAIGANAFSGKTAITYVMLPKTVTSLGDGAFQGCTALKGVSIPSRLVTVGDNAFSGCSALTQIALPNSVTEIGANAFKGDSRLFMVNMVSAEYSKLTTIESNAFEGCSSLEFFCSDEKYYLPDSITMIKDYAFKDCSKFDRVRMSDKIASLGVGAYQDCIGIEELVLSSGLENIPENAFAGCRSLGYVEFGNANINITTIISGYAFKDCKKLGSVELPDQIGRVCTNAFAGCTALRRIEVVNGRATLDPEAFPDENAKYGMCLVGRDPSTAKTYAGEHIRFVAINGSGQTFYTYKAHLSGAGTNTDPAITVKVTTVPMPDASVKDINEIDHGANAEKGVAAGTVCYINIEYHGLQGYQPVSGSIKYNGKPANYKDGNYFFEMPIGGAVITAEFETNAKEIFVDGDEESIEGRLSSEANYDVQANTGYLKVGQSVKFYLTNSRNGKESRIPVSKIKYQLDPDFEKGVVSVDNYGTIKALKPGTAVVEARVQISVDKSISKSVFIQVDKVGIDHISMLVPNLDSNMTLIKDEKTSKIIGLSISAEQVGTSEYSFDLKAIAFSSEEDDEAMESAFTWTTSDAKVAKVNKSSTSAASAVNKITIPKNTDGEATITVSAKYGNNEKISEQFIVRVENYSPRLTLSKITINPNQIAGATKIGIINSYGKNINKNIKILDAQTKTETSKFSFVCDDEESNEFVTTYSVTANSNGIQEKTYSVIVRVEVAYKPYDIPLSIVVKKSLPNPTVTFDNKVKINLFCANDGTPIQPIIGKLGDAEVSEYSLEPLTDRDNKNYEDDVKFTENFQIDRTEGTITQKAERLLTNKSGKPVLTGYLVLKFKGYHSNIVKKYKITIPTQTVAPSYVLDRTTDTFGISGTQVVYLKLLDKKTKQPIAWDEGYKVEVDESSTFMLAQAEAENIDGYVSIKVTIPTTVPSGRLVMKVSNEKWAEGKVFKFTYNIKIDNKSSKLSLKKAAVTLNATYLDSEEAFELVSNHLDEKITGEQRFVAQSTAKTEEQYEKLVVTCEDGKGTVKLVDQGEDIKAGSYKYIYTYEDQNGKVNKVTLTVKVTKTMPTVTLKGTNAFNLAAKSGDKYVETSEMTMTVKNLPVCQKYSESSEPENSDSESSDSGSSQTINPKFYRLDQEATFDSIVFATKGYENSAPQEYFDFVWDEDEEGANGKIYISLKKQMPVKSYSLKMTPVYKNDNGNAIRLTKPVAISIKIYSGSISSVKLSAKGKINLLDRSGEITEKNAIRYTPTVANLKDTLKDVKLYETYPSPDDLKDPTKESTLFRTQITEDRKSFYVVPENNVALENNKNYTLYVWVEMKNYKGIPEMNGGLLCYTPVKIKTAQVLPKVKTDKTAVDLYLSSKGYEVTFVVQKADEKAIGAIEGIAFGEKDEKAINSFDITRYEKQNDGSLLVHMKLKPGVSYGCNTTNRITMYIQFENQGTNTAGTPITMNVKINK